jgi:hypothetical protein
LLASHPFRRKKRKGWGTEIYSKSENALEEVLEVGFDFEAAVDFEDVAG